MEGCIFLRDRVEEDGTSSFSARNYNKRQREFVCRSKSNLVAKSASRKDLSISISLTLEYPLSGSFLVPLRLFTRSIQCWLALDGEDVEAQALKGMLPYSKGNLQLE